MERGCPGLPILKIGPLCHLAGQSWGGNKSERWGLARPQVSNPLLRGLLPGPAPPFTWNPVRSLQLADFGERKVARQRNYGNILSVTWTLLQTRKFSHSCQNFSGSGAPNVDCSSHLTARTEPAALGLIDFLFPFSFPPAPPAWLRLEMISLFPSVRPCGSHTYLGWLFPCSPKGSSKPPEGKAGLSKGQIKEAEVQVQAYNDLL